jgi:uncharacterized protein YbbC (DUF1343 family)
MSTNITFGVDVFLRRERPLRRASVGVVANQASVTGSLEYAHAAIARTWRVRYLFSPQHGFFGTEQANMIESRHAVDPSTGIPIVSLYAASRKISRKHLDAIDALVFDLQDVGSRYYTYLWTLYYCMEACEKAAKPLIVLDRPNAINGSTVEGADLLPGFASFVGLFPVPNRFGLTIGEFAVMLKELKFPGIDLEVVRMEGWDRRLYLDAYGNPWLPASPNIPTVATAVVYPGMCFLEGTNLSEGRGTTRPFELFGAPFINSQRLTDLLATAGLEGVHFRPIVFTPTFDKFRGKACGGAFLHVLDRETFQPVRTATEILGAVKKLYPRQFRWFRGAYEYERKIPAIDLLYGSAALRKAIDAGDPLAPLHRQAESSARTFALRSRAWRLYT